MKELIEKVYKNALIGEKLVKLEKEERQQIILKLLENRSERQLSEEIGIPYSTIHDWKTLRQSNVGVDIHVSFVMFLRKLNGINAKEFKDWGHLIQIKEKIELLLKHKED